MITKCKICAYEAGLFNLTNGICKTCAKKSLKGMVLSASEYSDALEKGDQTTDYSKVPWFRRWMMCVFLFIFITPVAIIIMWSGDIYRNKKDEKGKLIVMQSFQKIGLTIVMIFLILKAFLMPY